MTRRNIRVYGDHGAKVNLFAEDGRVCAEWRDGGERKFKSWPESEEANARKWAEVFSSRLMERRRIVGPLPTVAELWALYDKALGSTWRPKTKTLYAGWAKELAGLTKVAEDLTHADADAIRDQMRARGIAHGTIRRTLGFLRQLLAFAHGRSLVTRHPLLTYRYRVPKNEREARPAEYSRDELLKIAAALDWPRHWRVRNVIRLCGTFGARINAILHLRWDDVNFDTGMVTFRSEWDKNADTFSRPMTSLARAALVEAHQHQESSGWVFWSPRHRVKPIDYNAVWYHLQKAEDRAGVPHIPKRAFHGLRRMVVGDIGDLATAAAWLHHAKLATTADYIRERPEQLERAKLRLEGGK